MSALLTTDLGRSSHPTLLVGGAAAFPHIIQRMDASRRRIFIRCFDWRDDPTGQMMAEAVLRAADRGVRVRILKDRVGANYEYWEGSNQSFFHKDIALKTGLETVFLMAAYRNFKNFRQRSSHLAEAILNHPHIEVFRNEKRYDHSKVYVFDDDVVILGGMGIGDDFQHENLDFMIELCGRDAVRRFYDRCEGRADFQGYLDFDFLAHTREVHGIGGECTLLDKRLELLQRAQKSIWVEMAYMGDRRVTDALVHAVQRGIKVTLITSQKANILGSLNRATCNELLRRTRAAENLQIFLHPKMVHSKVTVIDHEIVQLGSANFTLISHGIYDEVDAVLHDVGLAYDLSSVLQRHARESELFTQKVPYNRIYAWSEDKIVKREARHIPWQEHEAYQRRRGLGRLRPLLIGG